MPAVLQTGDIDTFLPPGLTSLTIRSLTPSISLKNKYIQATVSHRYTRNTLPVASLKLTLENSQGDTIDLIAVGQVADDLVVCGKGDVLVLLEFKVENCPGHCSRLYQIVADDTEGGSLVWIFKTSKIPSQARPCETTAQTQIYSYKPLEELKVNTIVDVYGLVKLCKPPTKTRGSDFCCVVGLTDSSLGADNWLVCNIFSPSEALLPKVKVGDVIRLHRLKIQNFQGRKQGCNGPGFHWVFFRGSFDEREASSSSYTLEQQDKDRVKSLLEWWHQHGPLGSFKQLSEVQPAEYFNLICQVIHVGDLQIQGSQCKVLKVWDGSKFQGYSNVKMTPREEFKEPVQEDSRLREMAADSSVDVYLFGEHVINAGKIKPGDFVQLINLHAAVVCGLVELTLHEGTWYERGITLLSVSSPQVKHLSTFLTSIVDRVTADQTKAVKRQLTSVGSLASNNLTDIEEQSLAVDYPQLREDPEAKRCKASESVDLLEVSSDSDQSLQFSDADLHINRGLACTHRGLACTRRCSQLQDNSISSSGQSLPSSQPGRMEVITDTLSQEFSVQLMENPELLLSQDSFRTACSQLPVNTTDMAVSQASALNAQRVFLSLKTKPDKHKNTNGGDQESSLQPETQDNILVGHRLSTLQPETQDSILVGHRLSTLQPETQDNILEGHQQSALSNNDVLSLSTSLLCFDTAEFPHTYSAVSTQEHEVVPETEASEQLENQPRCMLKTASVVIGHHLIVPEFSLRTVLDAGLCQKHKVLVRVQSMNPDPVTPGKLVNFTCSRCGHLQSAESLKFQPGSDLPVHVCPVDMRQCQRLEPVISLKFILTDGQDSLTVFVWQNYAVQFFWGIPPLQLLSDTASFKRVQERLERLCPPGSKPESRPLLECCVFSYGTESEVKYHIFDTVLV